MPTRALGLHSDLTSRRCKHQGRTFEVHHADVLSCQGTKHEWCCNSCGNGGRQAVCEWQGSAVCSTLQKVQAAMCSKNPAYYITCMLTGMSYRYKRARSRNTCSKTAKECLFTFRSISRNSDTSSSFLRLSDEGLINQNANATVVTSQQLRGSDLCL